MVKVKVTGSIDSMLRKAYNDTVRETEEAYAFYKTHTAWMHDKNNLVTVLDLCLSCMILGLAIGVTMVARMLFTENATSIKSLTNTIMSSISFAVIFGIVSFAIGSILASRKQRITRKTLRQHLDVLHSITWEEYEASEYQYCDDFGFREGALRLIDTMQTLQSCAGVLNISHVSEHHVDVMYALEDSSVHHLKLSVSNWMETIGEAESSIVFDIDDAGNCAVSCIKVY